MEKIEDIVIIGGGPAGAYCAYELSKKGIYPVLFDDSHPREKPCGGGISILALKKYPFIKNIKQRSNFTNECKIISPDGKEVVVKGIRKGFNVSRLHLDKYILNMAEKEGTNLIKERVINIKKDETWKIKTKKRIIKAKVVIGADGVNSLVRKNVIGPISRNNLALGCGYFSTGTEKENTTIKFLKDISGFIWIFPRDNHSSIGIGTELKHSNHSKKILDSFISSYCPHIKIISSFASLLPFINDENFYNLPCTGDKWILIGDAAGHVDPITGEGILYAMWSGELAAKSLKNGNLKEFDSLWRKEYGYDLKEGCRLRKIFYKQNTLELAVSLAKKSKSFSRLLFDLITDEQDYKTLPVRIIKELPKIITEFVF